MTKRPRGAQEDFAAVSGDLSAVVSGHPAYPTVGFACDYSVVFPGGSGAWRGFTLAVSSQHVIPDALETDFYDTVMAGRALCVHAPGLVPGVPAIYAPASVRR